MIKKISQSALLVSAILIGAPALGQSDRVVKVTTTVAPERVKPGSRFQLTVILDIENGYHINSSRPLEQYLIATSLKLDPTEGLTLGTARYPRPLVKKFGFSKKALSVYEGRVLVKASCGVSPGTRAGRRLVRGKLRIQACNDEACLPPKTINIEVPVEVLGG